MEYEVEEKLKRKIDEELKRKKIEEILSSEISRKERDMKKALENFWDIMRNAIRNPKSDNEVDKFDARVTAMLVNTEERKIFKMFENEVGKVAEGRSTLDIRKEEAEGVFSYASVGNEEDKIKGLFYLQQDVRKCTDALEVLNVQVEQMSEGELSKIIALAEKENVKKEEIEKALAKINNPKLVDALYTLLVKEKAASLAVRNALGLDRNEFNKLFKISERNLMLAMLRLYAKILGSVKFARVREKLSEGNMAALLAELKKMSIAAQYMFFALLMPSLIRGGMWNANVLGILAKALAAIREASLQVGIAPNQAQLEYMYKVRKFISRFSDFKGLNLSMFSAVFISSLKG